MLPILPLPLRLIFVIFLAPEDLGVSDPCRGRVLVLTGAILFSSYNQHVISADLDES